jgi:hypothetical protein
MAQLIFKILNFNISHSARQGYRNRRHRASNAPFLKQAGGASVCPSGRSASRPWSAVCDPQKRPNPQAGARLCDNRLISVFPLPPSRVPFPEKREKPGKSGKNRNAPERTAGLQPAAMPERIARHDFATIA